MNNSKWFSEEEIRMLRENILNYENHEKAKMTNNLMSPEEETELFRKIVLADDEKR